MSGYFDWLKDQHEENLGDDPIVRQSSEFSVSLVLKESSWLNLIECIRSKNTNIDTRGNFWAAIQEMERQLQIFKKP